MIRMTTILRRCDDRVKDADSRSNPRLIAAAFKDIAAVKRGFEDWFRDWHDVLEASQNEAELVGLGRGDSRSERNGAALANQTFLVD